MRATVDASRVLRDFAKLPQDVADALDPVVRKTAFDLQRRIRGKASGRPGPRVRTGDYRRSWRVQFRKEGTLVKTTEGVVGTNKPQARRLEHGFIGMDSLGRMYNQPAFPHVAPALAEVEPLFRRDARVAVGRAVTRRGPA